MRQRLWFWRCHPGVGNHPKRKMTDIAVLDASGEDKPYYKQALPLLDEMLAVQSAEVDTVSGATLTAEGLIGAVEDALGKAAG